MKAALRLVRKKREAAVGPKAERLVSECVSRASSSSSSVSLPVAWDKAKGWAGTEDINNEENRSESRTSRKSESVKRIKWLLSNDDSSRKVDECDRCLWPRGPNHRCADNVCELCGLPTNRLRGHDCEEVPSFFCDRCYQWKPYADSDEFPARLEHDCRRLPQDEPPVDPNFYMPSPPRRKVVTMSFPTVEDVSSS